MTAQVREGTIGFGGWRTWYRVVGDASERAPLICLHGGPGSSHHYFARLEGLAERGRPVVLYDQVGCGGSSRPPVDELDVDVFVDELANLREELHLDRVFVLGTSWGGMLAMEYAVTRPQGLLGLVLNSTLVDAATWAAEQARLRDELPTEYADTLRKKDVDDPAYLEAEAVLNARHFCRLEGAVEIDRMQEARSKDVYRAMWGPNEWTMVGKLGGWDIRDRVNGIDVPVLITAGRHDMCTPKVLEQLQIAFPEAETVVFENSSHTPYLEEAAAFMETAGRFMDGIDPARAGS
ncbi:MAG: proline iminopeptidase-family hydrolase [Actinomycetota bacterium]